MTMPIEHPRPTVAGLPRSHSVVAQHNRLFFHCDIGDVRDTCKSASWQLLAVMIAHDQVDVLAGDLVEIFRGALAPARHITEDVESVFRFDEPVEVLRHRLVHFMHATERAVAMLDDVRVAEVPVRGEPHSRTHLV